MGYNSGITTMGGRAGGGARGAAGGGASPDFVGGVRVSGGRTSRFYGDAKVSDLKVGDVLQPQSYKIKPFVVKSISNETATTVDITFQTKGSKSTRVERFGKDRYVGARVVKS